MTELVYVADWQIQCCGEDFAVGDEVDWPVAAADRDWVPFLGAELAAALTGRYEFHEDPDVVPQVRGTVRGIRIVSCRFAPFPPPADTRELHGVPGSTVLKPVEAIEKWYGLDSADELRFCGWLVDLEPLSGLRP